MGAHRRGRPGWGCLVSATAPHRKTSRRAAGLRFQVFNAFVDEGLSRLKPAEAVVWFVLYRDTKPDGLARTAVEDIARRAGFSRSTALRALKRLEALRMLRV